MQVFTEEELAFLAELVVKHDAYALLDEVYEHLVFPGVLIGGIWDFRWGVLLRRQNRRDSSLSTVFARESTYKTLTITRAAGFKHVTMRALPGMEDRCLRIGSAGKTFSFTAWKVGWVTGPPAAVAAAAKAHQFLTFTVPSAYQHAVAVGLEQERAFYEG